MKRKRIQTLKELQIEKPALQIIGVQHDEKEWFSPKNFGQDTGKRHDLALLKHRW
jgi:hypothetical protein